MDKPLWSNYSPQKLAHQARKDLAEACQCEAADGIPHLSLEPGRRQNPRIDTYFVDLDDCGPMVLDALI